MLKTKRTINSVITNNQAGTLGGGLYNPANELTFLRNCIVWGNLPNAYEGASALINNSDIEGGYAGAGNIDADPLFADPANADYSLMNGSPCIDTGDAAGAPQTDIDGVSRPQGPGVDMGAYEFITK